VSVNVIEESSCFGTASGRACRTGTTKTVRCNAADALRGEFRALRFASAQLATAHKLALIAHIANAFLTTSDLLVEEGMADFGKGLGRSNATHLPPSWDLTLTIVFQALVPRQDRK
jgi:hypothetical protein